MKTEISKYGSTLTRMTRKEAGLKCPIALMKRKIADKKIAEAEIALKKQDSAYQNTLRKGAETLLEIFGEKGKEPTYSLGFQRWQKLNKEKRKALMIRNSFNYQDCLNELEAA